ncbi:MAG TPA: threonine ammonia-lyase [Methanoregulaceae archaeon]|nr:threonine ammonia-lyase [Methanoregulaceae archaeon]
MISYEEILRAKKVISPYIIRTPLVYSPTFSEMTGANIYLKLETLQKAGSFKIRGAAYRILNHKHEIGPAGVIAASAGNHAQGVAVAASIAGVPATIVMPVHASITKQMAARSYGARIILKGENLQESIEAAELIAKENGAVFIHPYDDPDIIHGQGTIGLEIIEDLPSVDMVLVPVGGGGLISGIATALSARPNPVSIIGVQAEACPSAYMAFHEGAAIFSKPGKSVADGILVPQTGSLTFPVMKSLVSDIVLVNEKEIIRAMLLLLERKKIIAEGAGSTPLAAVLFKRIAVPRGADIVLVISGGNIDVPLFTRVIEYALTQEDRITHITAWIRDIPGSLAKLLSLIAEQDANIIHIEQRKEKSDFHLDTVIVEIDIETRGTDHAQQIRAIITKAGYRIA